MIDAFGRGFEKNAEGSSKLTHRQTHHPQSVVFFLARIGTGFFAMPVLRNTLEGVKAIASLKSLY